MFILKSIKHYVDKVLFFLLFLIVFAMLLMVCLQVFSRYVMKSPFVFTEELVRFLLIWLGLLGGSYAFGVKRHIALTLFFDKCKDAVKTIATIIIDISIFLLSLFVLIIGGLKLISVTLIQVSSVLAIPMWIVYIVLPISGIIIAFYQIYYILLQIFNIKEEIK